MPAAGGDQAKGLAAAIAVVSCEGGASAEAFAKALSQSIETDKNGCKVLVTASSYAVAKCGPNGAFAQSGSNISRVSTSFEGSARAAAGGWGTPQPSSALQQLRQQLALPVASSVPAPGVLRRSHKLLAIQGFRELGRQSIQCLLTLRKNLSQRLKSSFPACLVSVCATAASAVLQGTGPVQRHLLPVWLCRLW